MDNTKTRDATFDLAKAVAIFMVVYWHVMSYRTDFELATMPSYAANFIIAVNMPLFFLISGYFSRRLHEGGNSVKLINRFMFYFWPMAFFKLIFTFLDSVVLGEFPVVDIPFRALRSFLFQGWFFQTLAICDAITYLAARCGRPWQRVAVCVIGYAACLVGADRVWYVGNVVQMIPFYWFGLILLPTFLENRKCFAISACIGAGMLIFGTFFYGNIATNGLGFYWDKFSLFHPEMPKALHFVLRLVVGCLGSLGILWSLRVAVGKLPLLERISLLGQETLGIFFLQGWLICHCVVPFVGLDASLLVLVVATCGVFLLAFCIVKLLKAFEWGRKMAFGAKFRVA